MPSNKPQNISLSPPRQILVDLAHQQGFALIGFARADNQYNLEPMQKWISQNFHAGMHWLKKHLPLRAHPSFIFPDVKTIMVVAVYYRLKPWNPHSGNVASYAQREDYHKVIKQKLKNILKEIQKSMPEIAGHAVVDSSPLPEKYWAMRAGLGFIGKNTLLINPVFGSSLLLGALLLNIKIEPDSPLSMNCGNCEQCITHCPTNALSPNQLNANQCISYFTIEHKTDDTNAHIFEQKTLSTHNWIFGCDLCLLACPYNQKSFQNKELIKYDILQNVWPQKTPWLELFRRIPQEQISAMRKKTPLSKCSYQKLKLNIHIARQGLAAKIKQKRLDRLTLPHGE